jgi:transposase
LDIDTPDQVERDSLQHLKRLTDVEAKPHEVADGLTGCRSHRPFRLADDDATRAYDKRAENFLAGVKLASLRIWMRSNESMA